MITILLIILIILFYLGYLQVPGFIIPDITLFNLNGHPITLFNFLIFLIFLSLIGILPSPLRQIIFVGVIIWILATVGILAIAGLSTIIVAAVILGLILYLMGIF